MKGTLTRRSVARPALLTGALLLAALPAVGVRAAGAVTNELIPSVGLTRAVHGDRATTGDARLSLRTTWLPMLKTDLGVGYRDDQFDGGTVRMRSWPITASLWVSPFANMPSTRMSRFLGLYAGGGVGFYNETTRYSFNAPLTNLGTEKFGEHVGAGYEVPVTGPLGLDLNARYIWLQKSGLGEVNRDNWNTTLGLAVKF